MTPLGHLAVSYSLAKVSLAKVPARPSVLPYVIVGGLAPDLDFLLLGLPNFNALHRSLTHNLFFVLAVAVLCVLFVHSRRGAQRGVGAVPLVAISLGAVTGGLSHLFVDAILDSNASNGVGVAALWPLSEQFFSPFNLAPQRCPGWDDPPSAVLCNLPLLLWEVPAYLLAAPLWWRTRTHRMKNTACQQEPSKEKVRL